VDFWSQFYRYEVKDATDKTIIDYFSELNLGTNLTDQNVRRLLRWKDPRHLTDPKLEGTHAGERNDNVDRVLARMGDINRFRRDGASEDEMRKTVTEIFPVGTIFQVFLFNIAKPHRYPIADQHVFRTFGVHKNLTPTVSWDGYLSYRSYFSQIAKALIVDELPANVRALKKIDDALMSFGQFLKAYCR
jgi:hypothetical protein